MDSERILLWKEDKNEAVSEIFEKGNKEVKHEKQSSFNFLKDILVIYKKKYVFTRKGEKEV